MALQTTISVKGIPIQGGAITVRDKGLLKPGQFSMVQNVKPLNPGFEKRLGQRAQHSTADSTNQAMSAYQFKKTRVSENFVFVQMSDGDVLSLTNLPPATTTGVMGAEAWGSGSASAKPASWGNLNDILIYSNGVDQHQLYPGAGSYVEGFVVYTSGSADLSTLKGVMEDGLDYTLEVSDGQTSTVATLNSLSSTAGNGDGFYIMTPVPAKSFTFTVVNTNSTATSVMTAKYWKNDTTWAALTISDGTVAGGITLAQSGTLSFTEPTDIMPRLLFGKVGYWYLFQASTADFDASVSVSSVTYDASWGPVVPMWDGAPQYAVAVLVEGDSTYDTYSGDSVDLDSLASGKKIYICSADPIEGIYIDPGDTPNTTASTAITSLKYWNGSAWAALTVANDGTEGMAHAGWILFNRTSLQFPRHMETNKVYGYWYELIWDDAISSDVVVVMYTMPYYDIADYGVDGQCNCVWKERVIYTWADRYPEYLYITAADAPQILVGDDAGIVEVGDGRPHKVVAMRTFFNNVLIWQEEKGEIGGCITMLQGYSPATWGKQVLSTKIGTMSNKTVDVVENVYVSTASEDKLRTVAFFISRYGVCGCDGTGIWVLSDDIQNYFDPSDTTYCIRRGYEDQMWLKHDPTDHVLRLGLVCGASATTPNVFPVYDLHSKVWYFDVRAQELSFWENLEAASGNVPWVQIGGGVDDGTVYQVNYGTADVATAIDTYVQIELPGYGQYLDLLQFMLSCKAQTGNITLTTYQNNISKDSLTLSMAAEYSTQEIRRHLLSLNVLDQQVSIKIQNSSATESMNLYATGLELKLWQNR